MEGLSNFLAVSNAILWAQPVLYALLGTGVLFTIWSGFAQYRALTHGVSVVRGKYDNPDDPGAISHFQALSAALSATVGLGNIGGVALAIALGGPGAIFWMWVVGFVGMAIKITEVTLSMLYRNTSDPENPHGGPMWVISEGLPKISPKLAALGKTIGVIFCLTLLVSTATGGNMFQAWNVGEITESYFGVPSYISGIILAVIVGSVIIGGIKRIGKVAGTLVPFMVGLYLLAGIWVLAVNIDKIPEMFALIITGAFNPQEATGAFLGGTVAYGFLIGMKRALFSNEAGQGSSPIAHSAAKTDEPVREGIVAGLEPFIDTIVVCTFTALIILSTGVWNRDAAGTLNVEPFVAKTADGLWQVEDSTAPASDELGIGTNVYMIVEADQNANTGNNLHKLEGIVVESATGPLIQWTPIESTGDPRMIDLGVYPSYVGATLTAKAFDTVQPGLGMWLVTLASWLFAISTMISWSYYGEQGMVFLAGEKSVLPYKLIFCLLIIIATLGLIETDADLDNMTGVGTGVMLFANVPIMWIMGYQAIRAYKAYIVKLKSGEVDAENAAS
ncbi:MAG: alanine/glycine:cation symporter family protein [Woeseiaceae bacterium]